MVYKPVIIIIIIYVITNSIVISVRSNIIPIFMQTLDIDECVTDSPCSINAECMNTEGSFVCECNTGFDGDGYNCTGMFYIIVI